MALKNAHQIALDYRLFSKRAAIIAGKAAHWASAALAMPEDVGQPVTVEMAQRFAAEIQWVVDIIVRDAKANWCAHSED